MNDEGFSGQGGAPPAPRFCPACGCALEERFVDAEGRGRHVCGGCGRVHYRNPTVVAGVIVERGDGATLLLRRALPPRAGMWVFPGGFVELGETMEAAALRECREEIGVDVQLGPLVGVYSRPGPGVVIVVYRGTIAAGIPRAAHEAAEIRWFPLHRMPWTALAFDTTEAALRDWATARGAPGSDSPPGSTSPPTPPTAPAGPAPRGSA